MQPAHYGRTLAGIDQDVSVGMQIHVAFACADGHTGGRAQGRDVSHHLLDQGRPLDALPAALCFLARHVWHRPAQQAEQGSCTRRFQADDICPACHMPEGTGQMLAQGRRWRRRPVRA